MGKIRSTSNGIEHCGTMQEWKDLDYRIEEGLWVWSCAKCGADLRADDIEKGIIEEVQPAVLFGRGAWDVNGTKVFIEVPGWYELRGGHWLLSADQSDR